MKPKKHYQIVIEGSDYEQVQELFEEIQNKYSLYDNCVMQEVTKEDSIVGCCCGRKEETGRLKVN